MDTREPARHISGMNLLSPRFGVMLNKQHSSPVIDTLLKWIDGDGVAIACVYCDFSAQNVQSASNVLGSVLRPHW